MFIYWSRGTERNLVAELSPMLCSQCSRLTPHGLVTENKKLRLYGIPVAKWGKVYEKMCGICGFATPASAEETDGGSRRMTDTRDSRPPTGRIAFDELDDVLFKLEPKLVDTNSFFIIMFGDDDDFVQAIKVGPGRIAVEARVASGRPVLAWPRGLTMTLLEDVSCDDYTIHAVEVAPDRVAVTVLELIDAYGLDLDEVDVEFSE